MKPVFAVNPGEYLVHEGEYYKKVGSRNTGLIQNLKTKALVKLPTMTKVDVVSEEFALDKVTTPEKTVKKEKVEREFGQHYGRSEKRVDFFGMGYNKYGSGNAERNEND